MQDLNEYLMKNFGKSVSKISETEFGNKLIEKDLKMISWDDVASDFHKTNDEFREKFSTSDGLVIIEKENKTQLFFIEFKNMDYSKKEDRQMRLHNLKNNLKQMKECEYNCKIYEDIKKLSKHLVDESHVSLRSKPSDSISLFYYIMKNYYTKMDDNDENIEKKCIEKLSECDKFFFLVSNTEAQYLPFKNKSNRYNTIIKPLEFLKRFEPYHYKMVLTVNKSGFDKYFYDRNHEFLN